MKLFVDVAYEADTAWAAGVATRTWSDADPVWEGVVCEPCVAPYEPGRFYRRELSPVLSVIRACPYPLGTVVVDAHVWLDSLGTPGLGAHLYWALEGRVSVIGVAKSPFGTPPVGVPVWRGRSQQPLWVSAVGMASADAAAIVLQMHGSYRIPTLLSRVHRLAIQAASRKRPENLRPKHPGEEVEQERQQKAQGEARHNGE